MASDSAKSFRNLQVSSSTQIPTTESGSCRDKLSRAELLNMSFTGIMLISHSGSAAEFPHSSVVPVLLGQISCRPDTVLLPSATAHPAQLNAPRPRRVDAQASPDNRYPD